MSHREAVPLKGAASPSDSRSTRPLLSSSRADGDSRQALPSPAADEPAGAPEPAIREAFIPWETAATAVELACALFGAQVVALYKQGAERPILLASEGLTQGALDIVSAVWAQAGMPDPQALQHGDGVTPVVVLPCSDDVGLVGLMYLEGRDVCRLANLSVLLPFSRVLARLLRGVMDEEPDADGQCVRRQIDVAGLYTLMERHEWNVARAARALGVTRMTVYARLRAAGIPRRRVPKTALRRANVTALAAPIRKPDPSPGDGAMTAEEGAQRGAVSPPSARRRRATN